MVLLVNKPFIFLTYEGVSLKNYTAGIYYLEIIKISI